MFTVCSCLYSFFFPTTDNFFTLENTSSIACVGTLNMQYIRPFGRRVAQNEPSLFGRNQTLWKTDPSGPFRHSLFVPYTTRAYLCVYRTYNVIYTNGHLYNIYGGGGRDIRVQLNRSPGTFAKSSKPYIQSRRKTGTRWAPCLYILLADRYRVLKNIITSCPPTSSTPHPHLLQRYISLHVHTHHYYYCNAAQYFFSIITTILYIIIICWILLNIIHRCRILFT